MNGYDAKNVEKIARALYVATKDDGASSWPAFLRAAETDETSYGLLQQWYGMAIAAIDLTHGVRLRLAEAGKR